MVAPIDISALRHEREASGRATTMLAHLRTEAYPVYARHRYPPRAARATDGEAPFSYERNQRLIAAAKKDTP